MREAKLSARWAYVLHSRQLILPEDGYVPADSGARVVLGPAAWGLLLCYIWRVQVWGFRCDRRRSGGYFQPARQVIHGNARVETLQAESAAGLRALNPHIQVDAVCARLAAENVDELLAGARSRARWQRQL